MDTPELEAFGLCTFRCYPGSLSYRGETCPAVLAGDSMLSDHLTGDDSDQIKFDLMKDSRVNDQFPTPPRLPTADTTWRVTMGANGILSLYTRWRALSVKNEWETLYDGLPNYWRSEMRCRSTVYVVRECFPSCTELPAVAAKITYCRRLGRGLVGVGWVEGNPSIHIWPSHGSIEQMQNAISLFGGKHRIQKEGMVEKQDVISTCLLLAHTTSCLSCVCRKALEIMQRSQDSVFVETDKDDERYQTDDRKNGRGSKLEHGFVMYDTALIIC